MKVRLKQACGEGGEACFECFNSMKVRLKRYAGDGNTAPLPLFQFHEGPIKTAHLRVCLGVSHFVSIP